MKKIKSILLLVSACVLFGGCGKTETVPGKTGTVENVAVQNTGITKTNEKSQNSEIRNVRNVKAENQSTRAEGTHSEDSQKGVRVLIAYFTRADNIRIDPKIDAVASASINAKDSSYQGNVAIMADYIKTATGGDTFSILTTKNYPTGYRDTTNVAKTEQNNDARPELSTHVEHMEDYDIIFLGYPDWWGAMPMPVYTFLEEYDFAGKTIIPFASHEGSGLGNGPSEIARICPGADVKMGFAVRGSAVGSCENDLVKWIDSLSLNFGADA